LSSVDFNHDGFADILASSFGHIPSVAYLNRGDGTFYKYWESPIGGQAIAEDINNDGMTDIVNADVSSGTIQVYQNNLPNQRIYKPNFGGEKLLGSSENDTFYNGQGNDTLNGGDGVDTLVYAGNRKNYEISQTSNGYKIVDKVGIGGTDIISNVEKLQFDDLKNYDINHKNTPTTGKLSVSGIASQGQIFTAINDLADVDGLGSFTYQWLRDEKVILNAVEPTYKLTQADVQKNITVSVNYIDTLGSAESVISLPVSNIENINDKPTGSVNIAGSAIQNKLLKVSNTLDDADGLGAIKYQWLRDGSDISNASQSSYTLTASDVGKKISVKAYYTDLLGTAESVNSAEVIPTGTTNQSPTGNATIKGLSTWGTTLSITNTIKDADGIGKLSYTWQNDKGTLSTSPTYTLAQTDISTKVWAIVSYTDKKGNFEEVKSNVIDVTVSIKPSAVNDALTGTDKADKLNGLAGNDTLIGGLGKDTLTGGDGADVFKFNLVNDSSTLPKQADTITDFKHAQGDKIDLSGIDINPTLAGNQSFIPINAQTFSADATGKLTFDAKTSTLYGSTNSDPAPEFAIVLSGVKSLTADDFIL
jgi:Ca2+-binding RTX toxin-like protein